MTKTAIVVLMTLVWGTASADPPPDHAKVGAGQLLSVAVATDASRVYWVNYGGSRAGSVYSTSKTGQGKPTLLADTEASCQIALDERYVYVAVARNSMWDPMRYQTGKLLRIPKAGGAAVVLADKLQFPGHLVVDDESVYFTVAPGVMRVAKTGGKPELITTRSTAFIALDENFVYVTAQEPRKLPAGNNGRDMKRGAIVQIAKDGKTPERVLARGLAEPNGIAVDRTNVYVPVFSEEDRDSGAVVGISKADGALEVLARKQRGANALRVEGGSLYWIDRPATEVDGRLVSLDLATSTLRTLDARLHAPMDLAVDASGLYYASLADSFGWQANPQGILASKVDDTGAVLRRSK